MDDFSRYTDHELLELYNWLCVQHRLVEDELAWRSRCADLDQDKSGVSHNENGLMLSVVWKLPPAPGGA